MAAGASSEIDETSGVIEAVELDDPERVRLSESVGVADGQPVTLSK
jgi:hypothetical protein